MSGVHGPLPEPTHEVALDPRVKLCLLLLFIITASATPTAKWGPLLSLQGLAIVAALVTIGVGTLWLRAAIALPFCLAALPLPFTTPGPHFEVAGWWLSMNGCLLAATIVLRVWVCAQGAVLLLVTTRPEELLWALERLHCPRVLCGILSFMLRYVMVLSQEAQRMMRARASRSAGCGASIGWRARATGWMVGTLLLRTMDRAERIYGAMSARGYDGSARPTRHLRMRRSDWAWGAVGGAALGGILLWAR